jgi:hypothetical protein
LMRWPRCDGTNAVVAESTASIDSDNDGTFMATKICKCVPFCVTKCDV